MFGEFEMHFFVFELLGAGGGQECPFYGNPFPKFKPLGKVVEL
jgi:hypothetical protein